MKWFVHVGVLFWFLYVILLWMKIVSYNFGFMSNHVFSAAHMWRWFNMKSTFFVNLYMLDCWVCLGGCAFPIWFFNSPFKSFLQEIFCFVQYCVSWKILCFAFRFFVFHMKLIFAHKHCFKLYLRSSRFIRKLVSCFIFPVAMQKCNNQPDSVV